MAALTQSHCERSFTSLSINPWENFSVLTATVRPSGGSGNDHTAILLAHYAPYLLLPPADWADLARCRHNGPRTHYPQGHHCNLCGFGPLRLGDWVDPRKCAHRAGTTTYPGDGVYCNACGAKLGPA